jgi:hypothetical protein
MSIEQRQRWASTAAASVWHAVPMPATANHRVDSSAPDLILETVFMLLLCANAYKFTGMLE